MRTERGKCYGKMRQKLCEYVAIVMQVCDKYCVKTRQVLRGNAISVERICEKRYANM